MRIAAGERNTPDGRGPWSTDLLPDIPQTSHRSPSGTFRAEPSDEEDTLSVPYPSVVEHRRSGRDLLDRVVIAAALALVAGTLVGFLGGSWWVFDLLANLRTQLALVLVVVTVGLLLVRRWGVAALAVAATAINVALVLPILSGSQEPAAAADAQVLDATFFNTKIRADKDATIAHLEARDDDVIVLAGADMSWVTAMQVSDLDLHVVSGGHLDQGLEILVMVRDPDAEVTVHRLTDEDRDALVEVVVQLDGGPVHVVGTHPVSPKTRSRAERRDLLLDWIGEWGAARDAPVVVMGDLNATPWSVPFRAMLDRSGLVDSQRVHGIQPSWPAGSGPLGLPIDHVLHSPELTTLERGLGPSFGSDHRMVHARITRHDPTASQEE